MVITFYLCENSRGQYPGEKELKRGRGSIDQLKAITGDSLFLAELENPQFSAVVHSVFKRVVNIRCTKGRLYSLAAASLDNAPHTLRISLSAHDSLLASGLEPGVRVFRNEDVLVAGNLAVDMTGIRPWQPFLPAFPAGTALQGVRNNLISLRDCITRYGKSDGLKELVTAVEDPPRDIFARSLKMRGERLLCALQKRDFSRAYTAGCSLLGLGGGHTPSGDDFCAGLMAVMNMPGGPFDEPYLQLARALAEASAVLTTDISQSMLIHAAAGRVREKITDLLQELTQGNAESITLAARRVLDIGSMSGTDLAAGIAAGMELGLKLAIASQNI